eukprot:m.99718 g.99718  ORF g.99718 m.99718 type:complete len:179 (+) comp15352_c0_seq2:176-712(+)
MSQPKETESTSVFPSDLKGARARLRKRIPAGLFATYKAVETIIARQETVENTDDVEGLGANETNTVVAIQCEDYEHRDVGLAIVIAIFVILIFVSYLRSNHVADKIGLGILGAFLSVASFLVLVLFSIQGTACFWPDLPDHLPWLESTIVIMSETVITAILLVIPEENPTAPREGSYV